MKDFHAHNVNTTFITNYPSPRTPMFFFPPNPVSSTNLTGLIGSAVLPFALSVLGIHKF